MPALYPRLEWDGTASAKTVFHEKSGDVEVAGYYNESATTLDTPDAFFAYYARQLGMTGWQDSGVLAAGPAGESVEYERSGHHIRVGVRAVGGQRPRYVGYIEYD